MINSVTLIGRLGKDPEMKYLQSGDPVATFSIATDESYKNKSGEKVEATEWHRCVAFKKLAEICGQYLQKGSLIYVEGKLKTRKWDDKNGSTHYTTEIIVNQMKMLGKKEERQADNAPEDVPF